MYPREWFDTYWRGNLRKEVFVVMSFAEEFNSIWQQAIKPAIQADLSGGGVFIAHRVDVTTLSGSIITEIYDGIAHAELIFADVSMASTGAWKGQRNGNAMYELGLATAIRPETDLVIVKSDKSDLNFDLLQIRVHQYSKDQLDVARRKFSELLENALKARATTQDRLAKYAWSLLDSDCLQLMWKHRDFQPFCMPSAPAISEQHTIRRLLELSILRCECPRDGEYRYVWTNFGKAVFRNPNMSA